MIGCGGTIVNDQHGLIICTGECHRSAGRLHLVSAHSHGKKNFERQRVRQDIYCQLYAVRFFW
jgi:hypothetical protein